MRYRKPYELKETDIEWVGEIPEDWDTPKIKWLFKQITSGSTPSSTNRKYYDGGTIPWVQTGDLNDGAINDTSKKITRAGLQENSALKLFPEKTLLIVMYGATIGKLGMLENKAATNQACCALIKPRNTISEFIFYWLYGKRKEIVSLAYGGGQPNISQDVVKNLRLGLPPLPEQRSIATFLDRKKEAIDGLIQKKEQLIERLKEKRQALITKAVTKGLDPDVPMKDSGIEWLGEIPEHWEVKRISHLANSQTGYPFKSSNYQYPGENDEHSVKVVRGGQCYD